MSNNEKFAYLNICKNDIFFYIDKNQKKNAKRKLENLEKIFILRPYEIVSITLNFQKIFLDFRLSSIIEFYSFNKLLDLNSYIDTYFNEKEEKKIGLSFFNYNREDNELIILIHFMPEDINESEIFEKIIRTLPTRSELNTNKLFPFIIFQNFYLDTQTVSTNFKNNVKTISLPFNFAIPNKNTTLYSFRDLDLDTRKLPESYYLFNHGFITNEAYSASLFENNNLEYIFMPFFPYISNCYGYDKYLYFFEILENSQYCKIIDIEKINIVNKNAFKGVKPNSDSCEINLKCKYDEYMQNIISYRWFSLVEKRILAYTTKEPIEIDKTFDNNFFGENFDINNLDRVFGLIPINFIPHRNGNYNENCFPNRIEIDIKYYHISKTKKKLYNIEVNMYEYIHCKSSSSTEENEIPEDDNINEKDDYDGTYQLKINYNPMTYTELLNTYQFTYEYYFVLIIFYTIIIFSLIFLIFYLIKKCGKSKHLKIISMKKQIMFIKYYFGPFMKGIFYGILILASVIAIIIFNEEIKIFYEYSSTWDYIDSGGFESDFESNYFNKARTSLYFIFSFIYLFWLAMTRSIPMPDELFLINKNKEKLYEELLNINKNKKIDVIDDENENEDNEINKKKDISLSSDEIYENKNEKYNKFYDDEQVEITTIISWKRRAIIIKYLFSLSFLLTKNYYSHISENIIIKTIILIFSDLLIEEIFLKYIFNEALSAGPLLVLNRVMKFIIIINSGGFIPSMIIYLITNCIESLLIIFLYPIIDKLEFILSSKIHLIKIKYANKFIYKLMNKIVIINNYLYNEDQWKEEYEKEIYKYLNKKDLLSLELILRIFFTFSLKLMSIILNPISFLLFYYFKEETKIKDFFLLNNEDILIHYLLISLSLIIPETASQLFLLNIIELYYNININDYLEFCHFRYKIRESNFINMRDTMKLGVNKFWRSLDGFLFSEQFFLNLFISSSSIILLNFGIIILNFYNYNPLGEPYLIFIIPLFSICIVILHFLIKLFTFIFGIFEQNNPSINKRTGRILEFLNMDNNIQNMNKFMTSKRYRNKFVKINKIWIIENLTNILGIEEDVNNYFEEKEKGNFDTKQQLDLKLKQIYQDALNYEFIENEIQRKKELINRDLELMPYNQDYIGQINKNFGIRLDISNDSESDLPSINIASKFKKLDEFFKKKENKNLRKRINQIAQIWKNKAKEILKYKKWSVNAIQEMKKNKCERCSSFFYLQVFQNIPFEELVKDFKNRNKGEEIGAYKWEKYFKKNQIFMTLCAECGYIRNSQMVINKFLSSDKNKESRVKKIESKILKERLKKYYIKGIALNWLFIARSKILNRKIEREKKEEDNINKKRK